MKEEIITKLVQNDSNHNLGQNKIEQQGPIPQIKDEAARRAKRAIFPSMICWGWGGGGRGEGGGGSKFSTYFVQGRALFP